ncbi:MAG: hypothetical protein OIN87_01760 [Candidatus Methanoperedens sp.]|nr:hypothetical protein [Candidatus Methanoperedens sp.]
MLRYFVGIRKIEQEKGKGYRTSLRRNHRNGRSTKKIPCLRLTKGNHANLFGIFFTRTKYLILALLAHPGDQELLLGKLAVKSLDFAAAGHADMLLHHGDSIGEEQISGSWLDAGRVWDREVVFHAITCLAVTSFRYPHVLQFAFCEWIA